MTQRIMHGTVPISEKPRMFILFFIDYVAIMGLFVFIGHYLARLLMQVGNNRKTDQRKEK